MTDRKRQPKPALAASKPQAAPRKPDPEDRMRPNRRTIRPDQPRQAEGHRKHVEPTSYDYESDYSAEEREFMEAMKRYKQASGRMFPTWSEVLEVLGNLGYEKAATPEALPCEPPPPIHTLADRPRRVASA